MKLALVEIHEPLTREHSAWCSIRFRRRCDCNAFGAKTWGHGHGPPGHRAVVVKWPPLVLYSEHEHKVLAELLARGIGGHHPPLRRQEAEPSGPTAGAETVKRLLGRVVTNALFVYHCARILVGRDKRT